MKTRFGISRFVLAFFLALSMVMLTARAFAQAPDTRSDATGPTIVSEGVPVHGHWTIEIRNPDGSLDRLYDFENGLTPEGSVLLDRLLSGQAGLVFCPWQVSLITSATPVAIAQSCGPAAGQSNNLGVSVETRPSDGLSVLKLTGSHTFGLAASITQVGTSVWSDEPGTDVLNPFTTKPLLGSTGTPTAVPVAAGQSVLVTVAIYFAANFNTGTPDPPGVLLSHLTPEGNTLLTNVLAGQDHISGWTVQLKPSGAGSGYITGAGATVNRRTGGGVDLSWYTTAPSAAQIIGFEVLAAGDSGPVLFMRRAFLLVASPSVVAGQAIQVMLWILFGS